jgi:hypothetical protein
MAAKKKRKAKTPYRPAPADGSKLPQRAVTIFGGGVTGLTAAHELIERGFRVEVWEPRGDDRVPARGCAVGGMARTQWGAVEWPEEFNDAEYTEAMPRGTDGTGTLEWWRETRAGAIESIEQEFYVRAGDEALITSDLKACAIDHLPQTVAENLRAGIRGGNDGNPNVSRCLYAECLVRAARPRQVEPPVHKDPADARAHRLTQRILEAAGFEVARSKLDKPGSKDRLTISVDGESWIVNVRQFECPASESMPDGTDFLVRFRRRERWLPGEHGYRFFPSFYSHLFDTMSRTPLLVPQLKSDLNFRQEQAEFKSVGASAAQPDKYTYVESGRTVYDNLVPAEMHALAFADKNAPLAFPRYRVGSLAAVLRQWRTAMERFDFTPRDLARYVLRIEEFAMMSSERRERLSDISWWDFVGGNEPGYYTRTFQEKIARWTEGLVAMNTEDCDARTYGAIMLQLISDQYRSEKDYRDGILNGPTSDVWLDPWRRYLEAQGVRFIHGKLTGFERDGDKLKPTVACFEPRYPGALEGEPELLDGYFILALPVDQAKALTRDLHEQRGVRGDPSDFKALHELELGDVTRARPDGMLRHFAGVQFYFPEDIPWVHGHLYYPDAPWGLSSISQVRYWQQKRDWEHGYRGVMSAIIGAWDVRSPVTKKTAWESTPEELAREVWRQLRVALQGPNDSRLGDIDSDEMIDVPNPIYWRLDEALTRKDGDETFANETPFVMTQAGTWERRPGRLPIGTPQEDGTEDRAREAYAIFGNVVLAGTYMKTFTRLTTMEAANESARHAVNSILTDPERSKLARPSKLCKIFPLEHREPADLALVKEIDARFTALESKLGSGPTGSLVSALGLDRWTAFLPTRRSP